MEETRKKLKSLSTKYFANLKFYHVRSTHNGDEFSMVVKVNSS